MLWPVPGSRVFLLLVLLPRTFGVDAGCLYAILPGRSVGRKLARPRNLHSVHKTATSLIQIVVDYFWCFRNPQLGHQASPVQVVAVFPRGSIC